MKGEQTMKAIRYRKRFREGIRVTAEVVKEDPASVIIETETLGYNVKMLRVEAILPEGATIEKDGQIIRVQRDDTRTSLRITAFYKDGKRSRNVEYKVSIPQFPPITPEEIAGYIDALKENISDYRTMINAGNWENIPRYEKEVVRLEAVINNLSTFL